MFCDSRNKENKSNSGECRSNEEDKGGSPVHGDSKGRSACFSVRMFKHFTKRALDNKEAYGDMGDSSGFINTPGNIIDSIGDNTDDGNNTRSNNIRDDMNNNTSGNMSSSNTNGANGDNRNPFTDLFSTTHEKTRKAWPLLSKEEIKRIEEENFERVKASMEGVIKKRRTGASSGPRNKTCLYKKDDTNPSRLYCSDGDKQVLLDPRNLTDRSIERVVLKESKENFDRLLNLFVETNKLMENNINSENGEMHKRGSHAREDSSRLFQPSGCSRSNEPGYLGMASAIRSPCSPTNPALFNGSNGSFDDHRPINFSSPIPHFLGCSSLRNTTEQPVGTLQASNSLQSRFLRDETKGNPAEQSLGTLQATHNPQSCFTSNSLNVSLKDETKGNATAENNQPFGRIRLKLFRRSRLPEAIRLKIEDLGRVAGSLRFRFYRTIAGVADALGVDRPSPGSALGMHRLFVAFSQYSGLLSTPLSVLSCHKRLHEHYLNYQKYVLPLETYGALGTSFNTRVNETLFNAKKADTLFSIGINETVIGNRDDKFINKKATGKKTPEFFPLNRTELIDFMCRGIYDDIFFLFEEMETRCIGSKKETGDSKKNLRMHPVLISELFNIFFLASDVLLSYSGSGPVKGMNYINRTSDSIKKETDSTRMIDNIKRDSATSDIPMDDQIKPAFIYNPEILHKIVGRISGRPYRKVLQSMDPGLLYRLHKQVSRLILHFETQKIYNGRQVLGDNVSECLVGSILHLGKCFGKETSINKKDTSTILDNSAINTKAILNKGDNSAINRKDILIREDTITNRRTPIEEQVLAVKFMCLPGKREWPCEMVLGLLLNITSTEPSLVIKACSRLLTSHNNGNRQKTRALALVYERIGGFIRESLAGLLLSIKNRVLLNDGKLLEDILFAFIPFIEKNWRITDTKESNFNDRPFNDRLSNGRTFNDRLLNNHLSNSNLFSDQISNDMLFSSQVSNNRVSFNSSHSDTSTSFPLDLISYITGILEDYSLRLKKCRVYFSKKGSSNIALLIGFLRKFSTDRK